MSDELFKSSDFDKLKLTLAEHLNTVGLDDFAIKDLISDITVNAALLAQARYRELHPTVSEGMRFTAEDFGGLAREYWFPEFLNIANAKLERILAQGVRVYGHYTGTENFPKLMWCCSINGHGDTHTGIVINIEELKNG